MESLRNIFLVILSSLLFINPLKTEVKRESIILKKEEKKVELPPPVIKELINYVGYLEIPKINFRHGFFDTMDQNNTINKGLEVSNMSIMPGEKDSLVIITGHSGYGKNAIFSNLNKLKREDKLIIQYNNQVHTYEVKEIVSILKGTLKVRRLENKNQLVLVTCDPLNDNNNLVIIGIDK